MYVVLFIILTLNCAYPDAATYIKEKDYVHVGDLSQEDCLNRFTTFDIRYYVTGRSCFVML